MGKMSAARANLTIQCKRGFGIPTAHLLRRGCEELVRSIPTAALVRLLEQTTRGLHSMGHEGELYPAQWAALRYFATTEPERRTAMALARFQGLAFGPVSRSVRTLIAKGLLRKAGSAGRGRAELIELTAAGRKLLASDPLETIRIALEKLPDKEKNAFANALELMLRAIQARHLGPDDNKSGS